MALNVEPAEATFPASGGLCSFAIVNNTEARHAFKIKTSNNTNYRVNPVFGFVEPKAKCQLTIQRTDGPPKEDKLVVQWAEVPAEEQDAKAPFAAGAQAGEVVLPLKAA